jgi:hypothetical protein
MKEIYKLPNSTMYQIDSEGVRTLWHRSMDGRYSYSKDIHGNTINLHLSSLVTPIRKITYAEFIEKYGTVELKNLTNP